MEEIQTTHVNEVVNKMSSLLYTEVTEEKVVVHKVSYFALSITWSDTLWTDHVKKKSHTHLSLIHI